MGVFRTDQTVLGERPPDALLSPSRHTLQLGDPRFMPFLQTPNHIGHRISSPFFRRPILDLVIPPLQKPHVLLHRQPILLMRHFKAPKVDPAFQEIILQELVVPIIIVLEP
jgi:hypothetical protein